MKAELVCLVLGDVIHVSRAAVIVGRGNESDLRIDDKDVSRRHCEIVLRSDGVIVRDLGSTHGTWFEGRRIEGEIRITRRSTIALGESGVPVEIVRAELDGRSVIAQVSSDVIENSHTVNVDLRAGVGGGVGTRAATSAAQATDSAHAAATAIPRRSHFLRGFVIGSAVGLAVGLALWARP